MVFIYKAAFLFGFVIPVRDKFMILENLKKLTYIVNTVILILVFGLMGFFYIIKATFLVYFSIAGTSEAMKVSPSAAPMISGESFLAT